MKGRTPGAIGAVLADMDGDSDLDLIVTSLEQENHLFWNDGNGVFKEEHRVPWMQDDVAGSVSVAVADIDGDADLDFYVTGFPRAFNDQLLTPKRRQEIEEEGAKRIQAGEQPSAEFLKYFTPSFVTNGMNVRLEIGDNGAFDALYINQGRGRFRLSRDADKRFVDQAGNPFPMPRDFGHAATFRDVDSDGDPDLYICNDFWTPDRLWINDGEGRFRLARRLSLRRTSSAAMGVDMGDINRDGLTDIVTVEMLSRDHTRRKTQMGIMQTPAGGIGEIRNRPQIMQNSLFLNLGDGDFAEIAQLAGVKASDWSWASLFCDVDLDGYEDLLVATGMNRDFADSDTKDKLTKFGVADSLAKIRKELLSYPTLATPNVIYRNQGDLTFQDVSKEWGFTLAGVSGGMALADLDNDGDMDVLVNNVNGEPEIYRNEASASRIAVRLRGLAPNTKGIGARVRLVGAGVPQSTELFAGGGYASGGDAVVAFAVPSRKASLRLEVNWRNGGHSVVRNVEPDRIYEIHEPESAPVRTAPRNTIGKPLFADVSKRLNHVHQEAYFDDFAAQSLLPNRLSQLGPGIGWFDVDGDGGEDLLWARAGADPCICT